MKTKLFIFSLLMAVCTQGFAQDIIHTFDSAPIEAKVLEIGESSILYKAYNNPDGPNYRMSVDRIVRIVFENGTERVFARPNLFATSPYRYDHYGPIQYRRAIIMVVMDALTTISCRTIWVSPSMVASTSRPSASTPGATALPSPAARY